MVDPLEPVPESKPHVVADNSQDAAPQPAQEAAQQPQDEATPPPADQVDPTTEYMEQRVRQWGGKVITVLTPTGVRTPGMPTRFRGHAIYAPGTPVASPVEFEIQAATLAEAWEKFDEGMAKGFADVEAMVEAQKQRQRLSAGLTKAEAAAMWAEMGRRGRGGGNGKGRGPGSGRIIRI
ncbi:MAG TPA: hypothetical protein VMY35_12140 [Phycisphaerae bacterium]|nr:hypothetical protein [Phycisphaerae bacterium]